MIDRFLALFSAPDSARKPHDLPLACAALLVEIMRADHHVDAVEADSLKQVLGQVFGLDAGDCDALLQRALSQVSVSNDLFQFTEVINKAFSDDEKYRLIHGLWAVAYADQQLDKYEEHMVRRIADLLYVPHAAFIQARNRARDGLPFA
ncbi:TerB family tellurite resistance protein [Thalassolituus sp. LLYu03]|uniref:tellurite resistance TerB family protein n=1 Tax=Thalassolituus sp. LLYu03 TaxID=3421656 RepID=UPI003D2B28EE